MDEGAPLAHTPRAEIPWTCWRGYNQGPLDEGDVCRGAALVEISGKSHLVVSGKTIQRRN